MVNVSCSAGPALDAIARAAGAALLDLHQDAGHNRAVLTMAGGDLDAVVRSVASTAVERLDLGGHVGAHPRIGVLDVVPFAPLAPSGIDDARAARDEFAAWAARSLLLPCFLYGPERALPEVRRRAWRDLLPDVGPAAPHPTAGATAVGARQVLVAYNVWLPGADLATARAIATRVRGPRIRALGLQVGPGVQVSMNLVDPLVVGPARAYDLVVAEATAAGEAGAMAELVGLVPRAVLHAVAPRRWDELDLGEDRTIEARLGA